MGMEITFQQMAVEETGEDHMVYMDLRVRCRIR